MSLMLHRAALFSPLPLIQPLAFGARMAVTGDSIMRAGAAAVATSMFNTVRSIPDWANIYSGGRVLFPQYANTAVNNTSTTQILARFEADMVPLDPDFILMDGGTVNIADGSAAILADYDAIIAICASHGWYLVIQGPLPNGNAGQDAVSATVRSGLASRASSMVRIVDTTGFDHATMTDDGVHPTVIGAQFLGERVAAVIEGLVQAGDPTLAHDDPLNLCTTGNLAGTGGTVTSASGVAATGWTLDGTNKGGATVTGSKATLADGTPAQQVVVSGNFSGTDRYFSFNTGFVALAGAAADDQLELSFRIEVEGATNIDAIKGSIGLADAGFSGFCFAFQGDINVDTDGYDVRAFVGTFRVMAASLVGLAPAFMLLAVDAIFRDAGGSTPVALTMRVGRVTARKLAAAGPPWAMAAPSLAPGSTTISVDRAAAPYANGAAISGYELRHSTDQSTWTTVSMTTDPQSITGLTNGTTYYVQTRAINTLGNGPWSSNASAAPAAVATTFDPSNKHADIALSESNRRATVSTGGSKNVKSTTEKSGGSDRLYVEFELVAVIAGIGICNSSMPTDTWGGSSSASTAFDTSNGNVYSSGSSQGSAGIGTGANGNIIGMAIDRANNKVWFSKAGAFGSGQNPATNTGGFGLPAGALKLVAALYTDGASVRIRTTAGQMTYSPPSGFSRWDA